MGLGSQDDKVRKQFRGIAGKHDWKALVKSPLEAEALIKTIKDGVAKDPNGTLILMTYATKKLNLLENYMKSKTTLTLKEYEKKN